MLVLSRKKNERIMLGDDIVVTVVEIRGDKVRLGIEAPTNISVHRQEVYDAIRRNDVLTNTKIETIEPPAKHINPSGYVSPGDFPNRRYHDGQEGVQ